MIDLFTKSDATFSQCQRYRYTLTRTWDDAKPIDVWAMLNPSTADAEQDDPTIRRCIGFSKLWGSGGIIVVNLFAWRATNPKDLPGDRDQAVGPANDAHIQNMTAGRRVVCAWGVDGEKWGRGDEVVGDLLRMGGRTIVCLGTTKGGHPKHPLYLRGNTAPIPFAGKAGAA